ncbi:type VI secretion system tube protein Hcp [Radicibacter daui]|uniref:type VI secretion system tube protein Hcp n=1 Tax=Radicibacter daui TaxID=3064829 RepID=UPI004046E27E
MPEFVLMVPATSGYSASAVKSAKDSIAKGSPPTVLPWIRGECELLDYYRMLLVESVGWEVAVSKDGEKPRKKPKKEKPEKKDKNDKKTKGKEEHKDDEEEEDHEEEELEISEAIQVQEGDVLVAELESISFSRQIDSASAVLNRWALNQRVSPDPWEIYFLRSSGGMSEAASRERFMTLILHNPLITEYNFSAGEKEITETFEVSATKFEFRYDLIGENQGLQGFKLTTYDLETAQVG